MLYLIVYSPTTTMTTSYHTADSLATEAEAKAHRAWVALQAAHAVHKKALKRYHKELCEKAEHLRFEAYKASRNTTV